MALTRRQLLAGASMASAALTFTAAIRAAARRRGVTVADTIEFRRMVDSNGLYNQVTLSPKRDQILVILQGGDVRRKVNRSEILLYDTADIVRFAGSTKMRPPSPLVLASWESDSNGASIEDLRWLDDGKSLSFLGRRQGEEAQIYALDINSGRVEQRTNFPQGLFTYGYGPQVDIAVVPVPLEPLSSHPITVGNEGLGQLQGIEPRRQPNRQAESSICDIFLRRRGEEFRQIASHPVPMLSPLARWWPSSNGRFAVGQMPARAILPEWLDYATASLLSLKATDNPAEVPSYCHQWTLLDVEAATVTPLINAPDGGVVRGWGQRTAHWSEDSSFVVVTCAALPLKGTSGDERERRRSTSYILEVDLSSRELKPVVAFPLKDNDSDFQNVLNWNGKSHELVVAGYKPGQQKQPRILRRINGQWQSETISEEVATAAQGLAFHVKQGPNDPPVLQVRSTEGGKARTLLDPNPRLSAIDLGKTEILTFHAKSGEEWTAGLILPVGFQPGRRYPLVIQTHGFHPDYFVIDGASPTAFPGRALASHGIAVLLMPDKVNKQNMPSEPDTYLAGYEAAIALLNARGLIDPDKIGLIGFSRTCFHVKYALVNSQYRFAAATAADGVDFGYHGYISQFNILQSDGAKRFHDMWGSVPLSDGLDKWRDKTPGFRLDRVRTPLRIEAIRNALFEWEWYAGLKRLKKPVEMVYFPDAVHEMRRVEDRLVSLQGNLDWFDFWLNGQEDPDPAKAGQYERWRRMRDAAVEPGRRTHAEPATTTKR